MGKKNSQTSGWKIWTDILIIVPNVPESNREGKWREKQKPEV